MTLKEIIKGNFSSLLRCIDPSIDLLGSLRSVPYIEDHVDNIDKQLTEKRKNNALLNVLIHVPDDIQTSVMDGFVSALRSSGQEHVANIFRRECDKVPMSDEHYSALTDSIDQLCQFIDPEGGLLNRLVATKIISLADAEDVRSTSVYNEMARTLIEVLTRKSDDAFGGFIDALNHTGQSHVTYMLTGEGNSRPLKEEHRKKLTSKRDYLVMTIDSKNRKLATALMSKGAFSTYDEQRVTGVEPDTTDNRNEIILNLVARKSQCDFFHFISALNDTDQTHVVVKLIGADVVAKITTVYEGGGRMPDVDAELLEYMREMFQTDCHVVERVNKLLSHNGASVTNIREGCIEIRFTCESAESLSNFRDIYDAGELEQMLNEAFCAQYENKGLKSLKLVIGSGQFKKCARTFSRCASMTPEHHNALVSSKERLATEITVSGNLLNKLSLDKPRKRAIEQAATREQKAMTLLDVISRRPDSAFGQLLNALKATDQHEAAAIISGDDSSVTTYQTSGELPS